MYPQESEHFMSWPSMDLLRSAACDLGARYTNHRYPRFDYQRGMAFYAMAFLMDLHQGRTLTTYAHGVVSCWGRRFTYAFPST